jgi:GTPase SAR1 family protein
MTLKLHPCTLIIAGANACGKSTFLIRLTENIEQLRDTLFKNLIWLSHNFKGVSFFKGVREFDNAENEPTLIVFG